ncbi:hypothetical protein HED60_14100 [Planctomycetales bacterium ZRK34]|nr:hypothetical protein HED60_14100 [Planctomycetales bacterium ZRK34]
MDIFSLFTDTFKKIAAKGPKVNAEERERIRQVVGELGDTLSDSLLLTIIYLSHARHARDTEFAEHLAHGRDRLRESFREFKICGGLYNLRDRFGQIFSPTKYAVDMDRMKEIEYLIRDLAHGERTVIDFLGDLTDWMSTEAEALSKVAVGTDDWNQRRKTAVMAIDGHIEHLRKKQKDLVRDVRHIIDRM